MNLLSKISFLKNFDFSSISENGFIENNSVKKTLSINPYDKNISEDIDFLSYSYVLNGSKTYEEYELIEEKFIKLFKFFYASYSISSIIVDSDKLSIIQYDNFLAFKEDLIKALREDTKINFLINELGIVVNCNFDLVIVVYFFSDSIDFLEFNNIILAFDLFINEIK